jgi:hypothetical protein
MKMTQNVICAGVALLAAGALVADKPTKKAGGDDPSNGEKSTEEVDSGEKEDPPVVPPKAISEQIRKGLQYLAKVQNKDGGWGQGGGWRLGGKGGGRVQPDQAEDRSDVGNSVVALISFMRVGQDLRTGEYAENLRKGVEYVFSTMEKCNDETLFVTHVRDTQLQSKIGRYVDTFLAAQLLAELKGQMLTPEAEERRANLLDAVVVKIGKHQGKDGAFAGNAGWASVLSQGLCSRSLNAARLAGAKVSDEMLERDNLQNLVAANPQVAVSGAGGGPTSAGVSLYFSSSKVRGLVENSVVNVRRAQEFQRTLDSAAASDADKRTAKVELRKIADAEEAKDQVVAQVAQDVGKEAFVKGFGNNGGEEFLSYMNISETLRINGGKEWQDWDQKITKTINGAQNEDGSWSGHHCITGRTFCTSGALLTLMADRAPMPAVEKATEKKGLTTTETSEKPAKVAQ